MPKQVLIADNDSSALESVAFLLMSAGYRVHKADSVDACHDLLKRRIIHAAVIDLRLTDNQHVEDVSGFTVARDLPEHIPFIIYTAYQNIGNLREALSDVGAKDMVDKSAPDASEQLLQAVDTLFAEHVHANFALEIQGPITPSEIASALKLPDRSLIEADSDDISIILRRLFPEAETVTLQPLFGEEIKWVQRKSRAVLLCVIPHYRDGGTDAPRMGTPRMGAPMVVKFGASTHISQEEDNYGNLIRFIGGARLTILEEAAYSREIGALCYRLFGPTEPHSVNHFCDLFGAPAIEPDDIATMVSNFFDETFSGIYKGAESKTIDIFAHYAEHLELDADELSQVVHEFFRTSTQVDPSIENGTAFWPLLDRSLPEPMLWIAPQSQWRSMPIITKECLCHGDMHSRNLLVDSIKSLWLIDFERVAPSHWLRDYVELETDVKFQLGNYTTLEEYFVVESGLLHALDDGSNPQESRLETLTATAWQVYRFIRLLRQDARQRFDLSQEPLEYYCALLISTLNVMQLRSTSTASMEQAYLSASLLCEKIQQSLDSGKPSVG